MINLTAFTRLVVVLSESTAEIHCGTEVFAIGERFKTSLRVATRLTDDDSISVFGD